MGTRFAGLKKEITIITLNSSLLNKKTNTTCFSTPTENNDKKLSKRKYFRNVKTQLMLEKFNLTLVVVTLNNSKKRREK